MEGEKKPQEYFLEDYQNNYQDYQAANDNSTQSNREKLNSRVILFIAFLSVAFGFYYLYYQISNPFLDVLKNAKNEIDEQSTSATAFDKDTDGDGLSDVDELNKYKTSPYLEDTDGDSIKDGDEVAKDSNPNCPSGQICNEETLRATSTLGNVPLFSTEVPSGSVELTPKVLRQAALDGGFPKAQLDKISDDQLMKMYQDYVAQKDSGSNSNVTIKPDTINVSTSTMAGLNLNSKEDLKNLSGAQIRALLEKSGAPADLLKQVSDDQLKQMFLSQLETSDK